MSEQPSSGSLFCTSCGAKLGPDDRFCPECGATRPTAPAAPAASSELPSSRSGSDNFGFAPMAEPPTSLFSNPTPPNIPGSTPSDAPTGQPTASPIPVAPAPGYPPVSPYAPTPYGGAGMMAAMNPAAGDPGVLHYDVDYPGHVSRLLIFVKWLLVIPHYVVLYLLQLIIYVVVMPISFFAILFIGRYPFGMWNFTLGVLRWQANMWAYLMMLRDEYPPFAMERGQYPPVTFDMEYPPRLSRLLIFVKWLLILPSAFVLAVLGVALFVVLIIAWFAILITGRFPRGMFNFTVGVTRWSYRLSAYMLLLTDKYPPFSLD